jgi:hypothetical protein
MTKDDLIALLDEVLVAYPSVRQAKIDPKILVAYTEKVLTQYRDNLADDLCLFCHDHKAGVPNSVKAIYDERQKLWAHRWYDKFQNLRMREACRSSQIRLDPLFDGD